MSQTLSLEPGRYSLFITPPVAGVDFAGTPTPSVSYQWRKNGIAISGQTAATITGVWVEQSGGTVDLVDGDTISIDIILTNPVQVTTKAVSAVIDASIPAPVISPISIRLVSAPTTPVSTIPNDSIGSQIMVASTGSVNVVTTPPLLPTYQWRRGFAAIAGATSQTYALQAADADSIIDCVVSVSNAGDTASRTASAIVGTLPSSGWTELQTASDSRLVYVSNNGNDAAAAAVYGRGYYLPIDSEIGADPTSPTGNVIAYKTIAAARAKVRQSNPDWTLLERGSTFNLGGAQIETKRGRSESLRNVITAYGNVEHQRPIVEDVIVRWWSGETGYTYVGSLDARKTRLSFYTKTTHNAVEDCRLDVRDGGGVVMYVLETNDGDPLPLVATLRRCVIQNGYNPSILNQGMFLSGKGTVTLEVCVFDRNGYNETADDASVWTQLIGGNTTNAGSGIQQKRTTKDRNLYASSYSDLSLRGCIISRGGGGGSSQLRYGGICERNLYIWNEGAMGSSHPEADTASRKGTLVESNVVLHDDPFVTTGHGWGLNAGGTTSWDGVVHDNVLAHFSRGTDVAYFSFALNGKKPNASKPATQGPSPLRKGVMTDNAIYREYGGIGLVVEPTTSSWGVLSAEVSGNAVAMDGVLAKQDDASMPAGFVYSGNKYCTSSGVFGFGGSDGTFAQWQAAGYDTDATLTSDFAAFKAAVGWTAPERDIVSYMQSVDPTYVVDEGVYVDEDAEVQQATRQRMWEVLMNPSIMGGNALSEARAKQVARRYHAFISFAQRAKANRKGAWDPRWTAEAVNNYIRAGFGKPAVSGAYDARSLEARLLDYTT